MAVTRIKNNQITDATITGSKFVEKTITGGLLSDNLTYGSNLIVSGNLTINGTTTTVDTTNTVVADPLLVLSRGETATPSKDSGIIIERGTSDNVGFIWDESTDVFAAIVTTEDGTTAGNVTISSYANLKVADLEGSSLSIDNIDIDGNTISSTNTDGNISIVPNGTGDILLTADNITVGDSNANATITTNGTGDLILNTNGGTDSGNITIADGVNGNISLTPNGTGEVIVATIAITDLTSGRVPYVTTNDAIVDSANLTFDGTLLTTTNLTVDNINVDANTITTSTGNLTLTSTGAEVIATSLAVSDLTSGRVTYASTSGALVDSANLTFDGTLLTTTNLTVDNINVDANTISTSTGNLSITGTGGEVTINSVAVTDLTSGRVTYAGTSGALVDSVNLTFDGTLLTTTNLTVDNINIDANTITTSVGNLSLTSTGGEVTATSLAVSDLTSGRVTYAGTNGALVDNANLTFSGTTLTVTGVANISSNLNVTGESTLASATISDLTSGRVTYASTSGALVDSANLTFDGTMLTTTNLTVDNINVDANTITTSVGNLTLTSTGTEVIATSLAVSDLTSGRVTYAGTSGALVDSANLTFSGTLLTTTNLTVDNINIDANTIISTDTNGNINITPNGTGEVIVSTLAVTDLTSGRVPYVTTNDAIVDSANLTFDGTLLTVTNLTVDNINIDANTIISTDTNGNINITPNGSGEVIVSTLAVTDLTSGRVPYVTTNDAIVDSANLTFNGTTLGVTGALTVDNITIDGDTISSAHTTITIDPSTAGAGGTVVIQGNLEVKGTTTTIDSTIVTIVDPVFQIGADSVDDNLDRGIKAIYNDGVGAKIAFFGRDDSANEFVFINDATDTSSVFSGSLGSAAFGSLRVTDLTNNRILVAGASGEINDSANLTFDGTLLTTTNLTVDNINIDANTITTSVGNLALSSTGGEITATSLAVSDLTSGRVTYAGTSGALVDSANLTFSGTLLTTTNLTVDNINIDANTITTSVGNLTLTSTGAEVIATSLAVSDLTSGRITYAGTDGALVDNANLTFSGTTLTVTGVANVSSNLNVSGEATLSSATISDLTSGRVTYASTSGSLVDSANLTFSGTLLTTTNLTVDNINIDANTIISTDTNGNINITPNGTGEVIVSTLAVTDLTSGRVPYVTTNDAIVDSANLTFDGTLLTVTNLTVDNINIDANTITTSVGNLTLTSTGAEVIATSLAVSDLTSGRVTYASTSGALVDSANLTFNGTDLTMASAVVSDLTATRVTYAGTSGALVDSANLTFSGTLLTTTNLSVDNVNIDANTVTTTSGNLTLTSTGGEVTATSLAVSDLTATRVTYAGVDGALVDSANLTFSGTLLTTTNLSVDNINIDANTIVSTDTNGNINITPNGTGEVILSTLAVTDLTSGRVPYVTTNDAIVDSANFTYDGTTLGVTGNVVIDNITIDGNSIVSSNALTLDAAASQSIVINEAGNDVDVRIESDTQTNAFFVEGSTGNIGIRTGTPNVGAALHINATNSMIVPTGSTPDRPTGVAGMVRFNTTTSNFEFYDGAEWVGTGSDFTIFTVDDFAGDGSTVAYTLSKDATSAGVLVALNGVVQDPGTAYSVSGTTLTFTEAPANGDNIDVRIMTTTAAVTEIADLNTAFTLNDATETATTTINGNVVVTVTNAAVVPGANVTYDLGTSSLRWKDLWLSGTTLALGNLRIKDSSGSLAVFGSDGTTPAATALPSITKSGTNGVGDIGQSDNTFATVYATTFSGVSTTAKYADLAENYTADQPIEPATVVCFGGEFEVTVCDHDADRRVAGVISTNPAHLMNTECAGTHVVAVALQGRVPCKVVGPVRKGDMMVSAGNGAARAEADPKIGSVIGKALENFDGTTGVIEVLVGRI